MDALKGKPKVAKPTPAQIAAAQIVAGAGGDVMGALMDIVKKENLEKQKLMNEKYQKQFSIQFKHFRNYVHSYLSSIKLSYEDSSKAKKIFSKFVTAVQDTYLAENGTTKTMLDTMKSSTKAIKEAWSNSDYHNSSYPSLMPLIMARMNNIVDSLATSPAVKEIDGLDEKVSEAAMLSVLVGNAYEYGVVQKEKADAAKKSAHEAKISTKIKLGGSSGYSGMPKEQKPYIEDLAFTPSTQKRAGIDALPNMEVTDRQTLQGVVQVASPMCVLSPKRGDFAANRKWMEYNSVAPDPFVRLFFRPCPVTPRHGFVDSKVCENWEQVEELYNATLAADPEAEIIIMSELEATASAVATSNMVAVGPGNDGATAGRNTVVYDLKSCEIKDKTRKDARMKYGEEGYIEAVSDGRWSYLVQLRGGPKVAASASRLCTKPIEAIQDVIVAEGGALEWEKRMAGTKGTELADATVVWSPGGSVLSHYSIHAILAGLALSFEDKEPRIGEPFEGEIVDAEWDQKAFARGVAMAILDAKAGRLGDRAELMQALMFAATGVHSAALLKKGDSAELLGGACATLMMLSAAACCGESRHNVNVRNVSGIESDRHKVFVRALSDYLGCRPLLRLSLESFAGDHWSSAYGGKAWAICAAMCIDLERAMFAVCRGEGSVAEAIQLSHRLLNAVHNGGRLLNKFGDPSILDVAARGSRSFSIHSAFRWYAISKGDRQNPATKVTEMMMRIRSAGSFDPGAFAHWSTETGEFVITRTPPPLRDMRDGRAQLRVLDSESYKVKVQYCFKMISRERVEVDEDIAERYGNIVGNAPEGEAEPDYISLTIYNKDLVDIMVEHAQRVGGLGQVKSMAESSLAPYVQASKIEPLGNTPKQGVKVYFGEKFVEVRP